MNSFSNVSVLNSWKLGTGNYYQISYNSSPYLIQLSSILNLNSKIGIFSQVNPSNTLQWAGLYYKNNRIYVGIYNAIYSNDIYFNGYAVNTTNILIRPNNSNPSLDLNTQNLEIGNGCQYALNKTSYGYVVLYGGYCIGANEYVQINLTSGLTSNAVKLYTTNAIIETPQSITLPPSNIVSNVIPILPINALSIGNYNSIMSYFSINNMVNFNGITMPYYIIFLITLIISLLLIAVGSIEGSSELMILGFVVMALVGLISIQLTYLAIIIVLIYVVFEVITHLKHK